MSPGSQYLTVPEPYSIQLQALEGSLRSPYSQNNVARDKSYHEYNSNFSDSLSPISMSRISSSNTSFADIDFPQRQELDFNDVSSSWSVGMTSSMNDLVHTDAWIKRESPQSCFDDLFYQYYDPDSFEAPLQDPVIDAYTSNSMLFNHCRPQHGPQSSLSMDSSLLMEILDAAPMPLIEVPNLEQYKIGSIRPTANYM
jgi:hypothetical protein